MFGNGCMTLYKNIRSPLFFVVLIGGFLPFAALSATSTQLETQEAVVADAEFTTDESAGSMDSMDDIAASLSEVVLPSAEITERALPTRSVSILVSDFRRAVTEAVKTSPVVKAAWYAFEASTDEKRVAQGGFGPQVDLSADTSKNWAERPGLSQSSYRGESYGLTLTQMLFDGFATSNLVKRLNREKRARYFEFKQAAEETAFEAARAYLDLNRRQRLVELAKENYVEHRKIYDQILERAEGGVSRGVDLEQANGRLSLAESNLLTEVTNLHDVTSRFQRVIGLLPAEDLPTVSIDVTTVPANRQLVLEAAYSNNPQLLAAIEQLESAKAGLKLRNAPMLPTLDLRVRAEREKNRQAVIGDYQDRAVELVLSYNLFNGGSDSAAKRQFAHLQDQTREQMLVICRNVRQESMIAYNNIESLTEQLIYLDDNELAISKARVAYRNQFDIGQRTLLDLLDTENEYFETRRSVINGEIDLRVTEARTLASMGRFIDSFNDADLDSAANKDNKISNEEGAKRYCSAEPPKVYVIDKEALFASLMQDNPRYIQKPEGISIELNVTFEFDSARISAGNDAEIGRAAAALNGEKTIKAIVQGHTDSFGPDEYNRELSERRAAAVRQLVIDKYGVDPEQITSVGIGEAKPVAENDTAEGQSMNRRVELHLE
ncbi:MAG: adhesin transport system outer membrane protein [Candidatus Azotimanducaceae bacterium]|jgi:adhesin transport system outer membrane protein